MINLFESLKNFGIYFDTNAHWGKKLSFFYLITYILILLNVVNIIIYLLSIYIVNKKKFLKLIAHLWEIHIQLYIEF